MTLPMNTPADLALRAREATGESQAGFARLLGVSKSTVTRWEQGGKIDATSIALLKLVAAHPQNARAVLLRDAPTNTLESLRDAPEEPAEARSAAPPAVRGATPPAQPKAKKQVARPPIDTRIPFDMGTGAPRPSFRRVEEERDDGFVGAGAPPPKTPVVNSDTGPPAGQAAAVESTTDPGKNLALGGPGDPNSMTPEERFRAYGF